MVKATYPWQDRAVRWLSEPGRRRALLFDEQGLGKTIEAIVAANVVGARRVLCLVPAVVLWNWAREWGRWGGGRSVQVIDRGDVVPRGGAVVVVTTHGLLLSTALRRRLMADRWDLLVVDEAHMFRNPKAKRTRALYAGGKDGDGCLVARAGRVWALTGTPMPNDASELWAHLHGLFPERVPMSWSRFRARFCVLESTWMRGRWVSTVRGNRNVPELRKLLTGVSLRRTKREVMPEMPPIRLETVTLRPADLPEGLPELEGRVAPEALRACRDGAGDGGAVLARLRARSDFMAWRRMCGLAKVGPIVDLLSMELECGASGKVVVFAWHVDVIEAIAEGLRSFKAQVLSGRTPNWERPEIVDRFQGKEYCRVVVAQVVAGGTGITLTAASEVVMAEASYVPGENAQAIARCHRIGQEGHVRVRFVGLARSADESVAAALRRKTAMVQEVVG